MLEVKAVNVLCVLRGKNIVVGCKLLHTCLENEKIFICVFCEKQS